MSASSFRFGYSVGTTVREIFRAARTTGRPILATTENIVRAFPTQSSASSAAELEEMCQVPAIVRRGINLTNWFNENLHECRPEPQPTAKKRKPRKAAVLKQVESPSASVDSPPLGSLNQLIA
jgi:hypothetical protein